MNEDDLEARLANWRPADPPPDLLRRLRASEPAARVRISWIWRAGLMRAGFQSRALVCAGLLTAGVLTLAFWQPFLPSLPEHASRPLPAQTADFRSATLDLTSFGRPGLKYAMLDAGLPGRSANVFRLDVPTGRVRLDCGYTMAPDSLNNSSLGSFNLNVRDPF